MRLLGNLILILIVVGLYQFFSKDSQEKSKSIKLSNKNKVSENIPLKKETEKSRIIASINKGEAAPEFKFDEKNMITSLSKENFKKELFFCKAKLSDCEFFPNIKDHAGKVHKLQFCNYYAKSVLGKTDPESFCNNLHYRDSVLKEIKEAYAKTYKKEIRSCFSLPKFCEEDEHKYPITDEEAEQLSILEFNGTVKYLF